MKITAKTAIKKIESGVAWVVGEMSTGYCYPEGDEYWILNSTDMETYHVLVEDAPELDQVKALPNNNQ